MAKETVTLPVSSGLRLFRQGWFEDFYETLEHSRNAVDLSWANSGHAKVLLNHDKRNAVGRINKAWLDESDKRVYAEFEFDTNIGVGKETWERIRGGLYDNVSVGWEWRDKDIEIREADQIPASENPDGADYEVIFKRWKPIEVSIVALPADESVGVGRARSASSVETEKRVQKARRATQQKRRSDMPPTENPEADNPEDNPEPTPTPQSGNRDNPDNPSEQDNPPPENRGHSIRSGYNAIKARRTFLRKHLSAEDLDTLQDEALEKGWNAERANEAMMAALEGKNPDVDPPKQQGAPGVTRKHKYSLTRAIQLAYRGELKGGSGSLEAELHADAEKREGIRSTGENEFSLPFSLLAQDAVFMRAIREQNGQRNAPVGASTIQSNATNAGMLIDEFDEFHLVEELYPRSGLFAKVRRFPQLLNQDLKVPVEVGLADASWVGTDDPETADRADTGTPRYPNNLEWSWKEVYAQFGITRKLIDQTAYLYDRVMRCIQRDIPRRINSTLYYGSGSAGVPKGLTHSSYALAAVVPGTSGSGTATRYDKLNWKDIVKFQTEMEDDNADYLGGAFYFAPSKVIGTLMTTERFVGSGGANGRPILEKGGDGAGMIDGIPVVRDNHIEHARAVTTIGSQAVTGHPTVSDLFYGIPQEIVVGFFSEMMMIVDPYSAKKKGQVEVQFRQAMDWQLEHDEAWVRCSTVVTD